MTHIAHISDTHLGNRQYGSDVRRQDFINSCEAAVEQAIEHDSDAIIHTGDLFHRRTPPLPEVNQCIGVLRRAADAGIPFYGIVGNHDRKMDDQWLDLIEHTGTADRLDTSPTMVGEGAEAVALYGIDAVPSPAWDSAAFELNPPEDDDAYRLLCMHQLLHPPVPEIMADYPTESVIDRLNIDIDGLALGDYHEAVSETIAGVDVWYAGSTERGSAGEEGPRSITLLSEFGDHDMTRQQLPLDTREFRPIEIGFDEDDGYAHAREAIENYDVTDAVAVISLSGKRTSLTASDVHEIALDRGAAVARIDDNRGREHIDIGASPTAEVEDPDTLIDQRLAEAGLSDPALDVESLVRDEETSMNALADTAEDLITDAQDAAFSGEEPPEAVLGDGPDENSDHGDDPETETGTAIERDAEIADAGAEREPDANGDTDAAESGESVAESEASVDETDSDHDTDTEPIAAESQAETTPERDSSTNDESPAESASADGGSEPDADPEPEADSKPETQDENDSESDGEDTTASGGSGGGEDSSASGATSQASFADLAGDSGDTDEERDSQ